MRNLADLIITRAAERPDLVIGVDDDQLHLADAVRYSARLAQRLLDEVGAPGTRIALVAESSTDFLITWMACLFAACPVALINPTYPDDLLAEMLGRLDPVLVILDETRRPALPAELPTRSVTRARQSMSNVIGLPGLDADPLDIASFMHTSGTTGAPKFCAQSHEYFLRLGHAIADALGLHADDRVFAPLPLFHINPLGYGIIGGLTAGADVLGSRRFSASGFWPLVHRESVTALIMHAPPIEILKIATSPEQSAGHHIRTAFFADRGFMKTFTIPTAVSCYGSTEAGGVSHLYRWRITDDLPDNASRYGGASRPDIDWRLAADGEIHVREREMGALFTGYFDTDRIDPARDDHGWFHTGDFGRLDDNGGLIFLERGAESIRVKGEFVPISFVESTLSTIAGIDDLALWKRPAESVDDEVVLYLTGPRIPTETISAALNVIPAFMRPTTAFRIAEIPRDTAVGKVRRRLLPDQPILETTPLTYSAAVRQTTSQGA